MKEYHIKILSRWQYLTRAPEENIVETWGEFEDSIPFLTRHRAKECRRELRNRGYDSLFDLWIKSLSY